MEKKFNTGSNQLTKSQFMDIYEKIVTDMFSSNEKFRNKIMSGEIDKSSLSPKMVADELWKRIK